MVVTWPTSQASTGWLKELAEENIYCAAPAHAHGLCGPHSGVCVQEPCDPEAGRQHTCMSVTWPTFQASTDWLKELADWNIFCAAPAHAHGLCGPHSGVCVQEPCDPDAGQRHTCMLVTWPTSQASTGWLKELAEENIYCAAPAHAHGLCGPHSGVCVQEPCDPDAGRRRTCMEVTWPTSHASTGWLKALAEENMLCATPAHAHGLWPPY